MHGDKGAGPDKHSPGHAPGYLLAASVALLLWLPGTWQFRSPGGVSAMWYASTAWALGCLTLGLIGLVRATARSFRRYVVYGLAVLVALVALANLAQTAYEQNQFDHRAHLGVSYRAAEH